MSVGVRLAKEADIPAVQAFIDAHWARGHVLSTDRGLFEFQHRGQDGRYHLALACGDDGLLLGILGGILTSTYDPDLAKRDTLWLTTWKTREDAGVTGLGLRLHSALTQALPHAAVGTVGNNEAAERIYRLLGYETGNLSHFALIDPDRERLRLAVRGPDWPSRPGDTDADLTLRALDTSGLHALVLPPLGGREAALPAKSPSYFARRYLRHPRCAYSVFGLERRQRPIALLAFRIAEHGGARALRMVDYYGLPDGLTGAGGLLLGLLGRFDAEYVDLFAHGLEAEVLESAGLLPVAALGATIVPSHFEPFVRRNIVLRYAFHAPNKELPVLVKADADQDRPNLPVHGNMA